MTHVNEQDYLERKTSKKGVYRNWWFSNVYTTEIKISFKEKNQGRRFRLKVEWVDY